MIIMTTPLDKDGELLHRLKRDGVNFSKPHFIEFNVDFWQWPPPHEAIDILQGKYGLVKIFEPGQLNDMQEGYLSLKMRAKLTYEFVTNMQREISECVIPFGGYCDSWAVLQKRAEYET